MSGRQAPIYTDAFALCDWLLERFGANAEVLPVRLCRSGLDLLEAVTLALNGRSREENIDLADECLIALRTQLRLAAARGYLHQSQMLYALQCADTIGRQLGGWKRALEGQM